MDELYEQAEAYGVERRYKDSRGEWKEAPRRTLETVVAELAERAGPDGEALPLTLGPGESLPFDGKAELETEEGERILVEGKLPEDLPYGYHILEGPGSGFRRVITAPAHCYLPERPRTWGWSVQLYSARSSASWGIGDLSDLARLGTWSADLGAEVLMVSPFGAVNPSHPIQPSPYFPSSRTFRNPLYISIEAVPGAEDPEIEPLRTAGHAINSSELINRDEAWDLKMSALSRLWEKSERDRGFQKFSGRLGKPLDDFATFCTIAEEQRRPWIEWPKELRSPDESGIPAFQTANASRIRFHKWLQWLLDSQLEQAGSAIGIINDLPVSVDPSGAEAWAWQDAFATGFSLGAPPDDFNTSGQDWGICPYHPAGLQAGDYEPFVQMIRSAFAHAAGLRVDHAAGLFRQYWIPRGRDPGEGVYVRFPARALLDVIAIESRRARAFVVGEDLGTVEDWMRSRLAERSILSYRLLLFEPDLSKIPERSLAAVTTHDLPTVAGVWSGADLEAQIKLNRRPWESTVKLMSRSIRNAARAEREAPIDEVVRGVYAELARCPAMVVAVTLEDALGVVERPNMPGTVDEWPNWKIPLPLPLEEVMDSPNVLRLAEVMRTERRERA
ncbi:MAG: 4-alpha-glucanotransferase [Actinomycetota bacterium]|nr:4-alpha-glucanotransferase [Actinomycetota bacterium]